LREQSPRRKEGKRHSHRNREKSGMILEGERTQNKTKVKVLTAKKKNITGLLLTKKKKKRKQQTGNHSSSRGERKKNDVN